MVNYRQVSERPLRFGELMRTLREQRGLSGPALARRLEVTDAYVNQLERGYTHKGRDTLALPTLARMRQIARALGVPPETFIEWRLRQLDPRPPAKSGGGGVGFERAARNLLRLERAESELRAVRAQLTAERARAKGSRQSPKVPRAKRAR